MPKGIKPSRLHWVREAKGNRVACETPQCLSKTDRRCRRCRQAHCRTHQSGHFLAHTRASLEERTGLTGQEPVFASVSPAVVMEVLTWVAKIARQPHVKDVGVARIKDGQYVAYAHVHQDLMERRDVLLTKAVQGLYADLERERRRELEEING